MWRWRTPTSHSRRWTWWDSALVVAFALIAISGVYVLTHYTSRDPFPVRANGLRVSGAGRSDASQVLDPDEFANPRVQAAYAIAHAIPTTLNRLYCWCHCERTLGMRSLLECFESRHAASCDVCLAQAEIAWRLTQRGVTDAARIQAVIDGWVRRSNEARGL